MKFKRISNNFWKVESMGIVVFGTWDECQKKIEKINHKYNSLKN
nr:hypothetical protein [uncultured Cetobacterium sp.]